MTDLPPPGSQPEPPRDAPPGGVAPQPPGAPLGPPGNAAPTPPPPAGAPPGQPLPGYAPQGYAPYPQYAASVPSPPKSGTLLAGGILAVIMSVFIAFVGLAIVFLGNFFEDWDSDLGAAIMLVGAAVLAFGAFGFVSGIGAIMRRGWGKVCAIVFGGVNAVFALLSFGSDDDIGASVVYLAMSAAIVVLSAMGTPTPKQVRA